MSGIKGNVREKGEFVKQTGFFSGEVVAINPDREQLEKLLGTSIEKDPEYLGEDEGVTKMNMAIWVKDLKTGNHRSVRFFLKDEIRMNKDKTKTQYINTVGSTGWADKEENLADWMVKRECREAHVGEAELYNFVINWLSKLDLKDPGTDLVLDWKKLMKGDVRELTEQINGAYCTDKITGALGVVCLVTIKTVEKDGETKEYEQVYNREFLPSYIMANIRVRKIDENWINIANNLDKKKRSKLQKFILAIVDSEHGIKDYYTLNELEDYDPSKNIVASDKVINNDDTSY